LKTAGQLSTLLGIPDRIKIVLQYNLNAFMFTNLTVVIDIVITSISEFVSIGVRLRKVWNVRTIVASISDSVSILVVLLGIVNKITVILEKKENMKTSEQ
jgi:hypothetical protein